MKEESRGRRKEVREEKTKLEIMKETKSRKERRK